jgi:hypothetical protein
MTLVRCCKIKCKRNKNNICQAQYIELDMNWDEFMCYTGEYEE